MLAQIMSADVFFMWMTGYVYNSACDFQMYIERMYISMVKTNEGKKEEKGNSQ